MNRIRRFSERILESNRDAFTTDFEKNKSLVAEVARIRSKQLRNEVAGYITRLMRGEQIEKPKGTTPEASA